MDLTAEQQRHLLALARDAIAARIAGRPEPSSPELRIPDAPGVFVTVRIAGDLRGCLGALESERGLAADVIQCAADAATRDPRFTPLSPAELGALSLEISVLGPFEACDPSDPDAIAVGRHGLLVERGRQRGLLLPQVAVEWAWNTHAFLRQTCLKAGLPADAWQRDAVVYRFTAQVFGDSEA